LEFLEFLHKEPSIENIDLLFNPTPGRRALLNFGAHMAIRYILYSREEDLIPVMKFLGMPQNLKATLALSPYKVAVNLFKFYTSHVNYWSF